MESVLNLFTLFFVFFSIPVLFVILIKQRLLVKLVRRVLIIFSLTFLYLIFQFLHVTLESQAFKVLFFKLKFIPAALTIPVYISFLSQVSMRRRPLIFKMLFYFYPLVFIIIAVFSRFNISFVNGYFVTGQLFTIFMVILLLIFDLGLLALGIEIFILKSKREYSVIIFASLFFICAGITTDLILLLTHKTHFNVFFPLAILLIYFIMGYKLIFKFIRFYNRIAKNTKLERELVTFMHTGAEQASGYLQDNPEIAYGVIKKTITGGDYFIHKDYSEDSDIFIMGDIHVQGLAGAFFETMSRSYIDVFIQRKQKPSEILSSINHFIITRHSEKTGMSMFVCKRNKAMKEITVSSAGHITQYLYNLRMSKFIPLKASGKMIGIDTDVDYTKRNYKYEKGDILVLFSDGLHSAVNSRHEHFDKNALLSIIKKTCSRDALKIVQMVMKSFREFGFSNKIKDDVTVLIIKL